MLPQDKLAYLSSTALFQAIDSLALQKLLASLEWCFLAGGEVLFHAGDAGDATTIADDWDAHPRVWIRRNPNRKEFLSARA